MSIRMKIGALAFGYAVLPVRSLDDDITSAAAKVAQDTTQAVPFLKTPAPRTISSNRRLRSRPPSRSSPKSTLMTCAEERGAASRHTLRP
jgi:hypothetical protein